MAKNIIMSEAFSSIVDDTASVLIGLSSSNLDSYSFSFLFPTRFVPSFCRRYYHLRLMALLSLVSRYFTGSQASVVQMRIL